MVFRSLIYIVSSQTRSQSLLICSSKAMKDWGEIYMLSIKPRQRAGGKGVMFKLVKSSSSEVHCETLFQKV